eukprot:TRINITY_DN9383_c0_g1_i1.p1 TRINITY_DN9383_c0_g1~~TRINITY_DN9383_c0_g1_i1.p1  ORF type:complete len:356 (+),score=57.55 TRINITY_DN9383_c0_g1_i1:251-1318(+)
MDNFSRRYEIQEVLGQGSFAEVVLVRERKTKKQFAAKVFCKTRRNCNPIMQELQVFDILRRFPHPNIVGCYESFDEQESLVLIYEYLPNGDLMSFIYKRAPNEGEVKKMFYGLTQAVKHLHSLGIAHRDIKLENICFGKGGVPKLIDFNLSCGWSVDKYLKDYCGSIYYCAPELFLRKPYQGPEADVWSLGVVLFSLLFLRFPFNLEADELWTTDQDGKALMLSDETKNRKIALRVVHGKYTMESSLKVSETAKNLIKGIFEKDVQKRLTIQHIEEHKWLEDFKKPSGEKKSSKPAEAKEKSVSETLLQRLLKFNVPKKEVIIAKKHVKSCDSDSFSSIYKSVSAVIESLALQSV